MNVLNYIDIIILGCIATLSMLVFLLIWIGVLIADYFTPHSMQPLDYDADGHEPSLLSNQWDIPE